MELYLDIKIKPDDEIPIYFIRNKTFTKLHKALHDSQQTSIGVSFPNYKLKLGDTIRLHGDKASLQTLQGLNWLGGLSGYCEVSEVLAVPETIEGHRTVSRIQPTMTFAKLKKRIEYQKARGDLKTPKEIEAYEKQYKAKMYAESFDNPYLELQSSSTGNLYRLFINFGKLQSDPVEGEFNHFGLSKTATIPWF
jgi:CRISPR-associated endonuclease Csy4